MNAVIKYPGAKWSLAQWIISKFPPHHSYLEPFFGSGAVLFTKGRSNIETVNDLDGDVVNFFDWVRKDPEKLAKAIYRTPYARAVYDQAWASQYSETDSFQRAYYFCARRMSLRENTLALLYALSDGEPHTQKQVSADWLRGWRY